MMAPVGKDAREQRRLGVRRQSLHSPIWSASAECRPLSDYAKSSRRGARPLTMASDASTVTPRRWRQKLPNSGTRDALRPAAEDLDRLEEAAGALERLLRESSDDAPFTPAGRVGVMIRAITSLAGYGANLFEAYGTHSAADAARCVLTRMRIPIGLILSGAPAKITSIAGTLGTQAACNSSTADRC
jgi:hypothetical protein